jgi:hypothetical protein
MVITASVISLLAILLAPILLVRFRNRWVAAFNLAVTNRITGLFAVRRDAAKCRIRSGHRTVSNEKLVPLVIRHSQRCAVAFRSTRNCCSPKLYFHNPHRIADIAFRLGNLVSDSTARKDGVQERLRLVRTNYGGLPPFRIPITVEKSRLHSPLHSLTGVLSANAC